MTVGEYIRSIPLRLLLAVWLMSCFIGALYECAGSWGAGEPNWDHHLQDWSDWFEDVWDNDSDMVKKIGNG